MALRVWTVLWISTLLPFGAIAAENACRPLGQQSGTMGALIRSPSEHIARSDFIVSRALETSCYVHAENDYRCMFLTGFRRRVPRVIILSANISPKSEVEALHEECPTMEKGLYDEACRRNVGFVPTDFRVNHMEAVVYVEADLMCISRAKLD